LRRPPTDLVNIVEKHIGEWRNSSGRFSPCG